MVVVVVQVVGAVPVAMTRCHTAKRNALNRHCIALQLPRPIETTITPFWRNRFQAAAKGEATRPILGAINAMNVASRGEKNVHECRSTRGGMLNLLLLSQSLHPIYLRCRGTCRLSVHRVPSLTYVLTLNSPMHANNTATPRNIPVATNAAGSARNPDPMTRLLSEQHSTFFRGA